MEGRMGNGLILGLHLAEIRDAGARRLVPRAEPEDREVPLLGAITRIVGESPSSAHGCTVSEMLRHFRSQAQADSFIDLAVP
jgi:hypothetical protein